MGAVGMGGLFFRAKNPDALGAWYRDHLNVGAGCSAEGDEPSDPYSWHTKSGPMVFAPFAADTDYFPADRQYMINFRVADLEHLIDKLRSAGIEVETRLEWDSPEAGKFARIHDPEGNPIELWQMPD